MLSLNHLYIAQVPVLLSYGTDIGTGIIHVMLLNGTVISEWQILGVPAFVLLWFTSEGIKRRLLGSGAPPGERSWSWSGSGSGSLCGLGEGQGHGHGETRGIRKIEGF